MKPTSNEKLKFPKAQCVINGSVEGEYSVEQLLKMEQDEPDHFALVKKHLFCPLCGCAQLTFHHSPKSKRYRAYLLARDRTRHADGCRHKGPRSSTKTISHTNIKPTAKAISAKLKSLLLLLDSNAEPEDSPKAARASTGRQSRREVTKDETTLREMTIIPQMKLSKPIRDVDMDTQQAFYGKVSLAWRTDLNATYPYELYIYHSVKKHLICVLKFSAGVYEHLPETLFKNKNVPFNDGISFYTQFTHRYPTRYLRQTHNENICTGVINYSDSIKFQSTTSDQ